MKQPLLVAFLFGSSLCGGCAPASSEGEDAPPAGESGGATSENPGGVASGGAPGQDPASGGAATNGEGSGGDGSGGGLSFTCSGAQTYSVTFDVTWTEEAFPTDYPTEGMGIATWDAAHMSPLIGASHGLGWAPWKVGEVSSEGTEVMAEKGDASPLQTEIQAAISAGTALSIAKGSGAGYPPSSDGATFQVSETFPLVTLASMLAPSPDWFAGVTGLSLCENGAWLPSLTVDVMVYDAGTDNGEGYNYGWQDTQPPAPIAPLTDGYFATTNIVGKFTFTKK